MKLSIALVCFASILLLQGATGFQFTRFNRMGLPLNRMGVGLRFGAIGGFGMFNPIMGGGFFGPFGFGKREAMDEKVACNLVSELKKLTCAGKETFSCDLEEHMTNVTLRAPYSIIIRDMTLVKNETTYGIFGQETDPRVLTKNTFVNPFDKSEVLLSLWGAENVTCTGYRFVKSACWEQFSTLVSTIKPVNLDFEINLSAEAKTVPEVATV